MDDPADVGTATQAVRCAPELVAALAARYAIGTALGRGGMADVFRAHDLRHDRDVAIKVIHAHDMAPADSERFLREIRIIASLTHPNIIPLFDSGHDAGLLWYAMPLLTEGTLAQRLARERPLPVAEAVRLAAELGDALEHAHRHGLVHRDVKPGNVLLAGGRAMIADFGLARLSESTTAPRVTPSSARVGTPLYMSPEQAMGEGHVDGRADQYSLACVLYELLVGVPPFDARQLEAITYQHRNVQPLPVRERRPETPSWVALALQRALAKRPEDRFPNMAQFAEALRTDPATAADTVEVHRTPLVQPVDASSFVGRENELWEAMGLVRRSRLVTVTGPGGCGKTRFARRLAERLAPEHPGGTWYAELAGAGDAERVAQRVGLAAGVREAEGTALEDALASAFERGAPALLLLDDCDRGAQACGALATRLLARCPHLRVLATSRQPLQVPGEQLDPLPPLGVPPAGVREDRWETMAHDAVRLFCERATAVDPGFHPGGSDLAAIAEITRRLDGLPLAIELAAARLRMLSVPELLEHLSDRFRLLTDTRRDVPDRHRTLQAAVDWSHDQLDDDERQMLRRLSVFRGGWTLAAATAVCDEQGDDIRVLDRLTRLADRSLLALPSERTHRTRYRLHETIREYAALRIEEAGERDAISLRHLEYFARLAEMAYERFVTPEQEGWMEQLRDEHENLLAALDVCAAAPGEGPRGLQLASALYRHWYTHGQFALGRRELARALGHEGAQAPSRMRARVLFSRAGLAELQGDFAPAREDFLAALEIYRTLGDASGVARANIGLASIEARFHRFGEARAHVNASAAIYRERHDDAGLAYALCREATIAIQEGCVEEARVLLDEALPLVHRTGNASLLASAMVRLAVASLLRNDTARARESLHTALRLVERLDARETAPDALVACVALALDLGDRATAARLLGASAVMHSAQESPEDDTVEIVDARSLRARLQAAGLAAHELERLMDEGRQWTFEHGVRSALEWLKPMPGAGPPPAQD